MGRNNPGIPQLALKAKQPPPLAPLYTAWVWCQLVMSPPKAITRKLVILSNKLITCEMVHICETLQQRLLETLLSGKFGLKFLSSEVNDSNLLGQKSYV